MALPAIRTHRYPNGLCMNHVLLLNERFIQGKYTRLCPLGALPPKPCAGSAAH